MNCPSCRAPGAYVGLVAVECPNPTCNHYRPAVVEPPASPDPAGLGYWVLESPTSKKVLSPGVYTFGVGSLHNKVCVFTAESSLVSGIQAGAGPDPQLLPFKSFSRLDIVRWVGPDQWLVIPHTYSAFVPQTAEFLDVAPDVGPQGTSGWLTFSKIASAELQVEATHCQFTYAYRGC